MIGSGSVGAGVGAGTGVGVATGSGAGVCTGAGLGAAMAVSALPVTASGGQSPQAVRVNAASAAASSARGRVLALAVRCGLSTFPSTKGAPMNAIDKFDIRLEALDRAKAPALEKQCAINSYERLRTARAIAESLFTKPTNAVVVAVFAELCADSRAAADLALRASISTNTNEGAD